MKISIVMTVFNNCECIVEAVESFLDQTISQNMYELIVIDDGSSDDTYKILSDLVVKYNFKLVTQKNSGVSRARNNGVSYTNYPIIFFTQGDIIAAENVIEIHTEFHDQNSLDVDALVGNITWYPKLEVTPFMRWLEHGGPQFAFDRLVSGEIADHLSFYTPHVSMKKSFFERAGGFDETFAVSEGITAYEDTEFAWRLTKMGMRLFYDARAQVFHFHRKSLQSVLRRRYYEGAISVKLHQRHPDFTFNLGKKTALTTYFSDTQRTQLSSLLLHPWVMKMLTKVAEYCEKRCNVPILYKLVCRYAYNQGMQDHTNTQ